MPAAVERAETPGAGLEPGDRFEVLGDGSGDRLALPGVFGPGGFAVDRLEGPDGRPLVLTPAPGGRGLVVPGLGALLGGPWAVNWLEYRAPGSFRLVVGPGPSAPDVGELTTEQGIRLALDPNDAAVVRGGEGRGRAADLGQFDLALRAARLALHAGFDRLIALPLVRDVDPLEHQIRTAQTVLRRFRGRALLCDEVGLGKTIEAGLILAELAMRGLVRSVLVLVPPSLIEQWQGEMRRKFSIELTSHDDPAFREQGAAAWGSFDRVIASIHTAKRDPHRSAILARTWDIVIVDEAHHLRNRTTQAWKFASALRKQFILLLTATPVQNNLEELFNLVTLLEPGLLSTAKRFQSQFVDRRDKLTPRNVDELHALLAEVMVRNRRSTVGLQFTRRWARTESVAPSPAERDLYRDVTDFVRARLRSVKDKDKEKGKGKDKESGSLTRMALLTLQMALGSSSPAAAGTLRKVAENPRLSADDRTRLAGLAERAGGQSSSTKVDRLLGLVGGFPDKMVIFTQFLATQELLRDRLRGAGHEVSVFHGGLSRLEKEAAVDRFRGPARLLLCTEAGSEGRNLQFAQAVCNFDLPWNPMRIEQRIGRLSRIGQTRDVHVFNLVAAGTLEASVLHLLEAKLNMFELVIGEVDMILGNLDDEREFQDVVADLWADSDDGDDFARRIDELGERLLEAKRAYLRSRSHDDRLFGNRFAPEG
jgi:SNF2 family DNA or RNA helicase